MSGPSVTGGGASPNGPRRPRRRVAGPDRGPRPLRDGLDQAVDRLLPTVPSTGASGGDPTGHRSTEGGGEADKPKVTVLASVLGRWEEIAGAELAGHSHPVGMSGTTLVVATDHAARATQVRMLSSELLERIRDVTGSAPREIRVVVRPGIGDSSTPRERGPVG